MIGHLEALEMDMDKYEAWCWDHGFGLDRDKDDAALERELAVHEQQVQHHQEDNDFLRNPVLLIERACDDSISPDSLNSPEAKAFCARVRRSSDDEESRSSLRQLLMSVHQQADFLFQRTEVVGTLYGYVDALITLNEKRENWRRPLEDWRATGHNPRQQFGSLLRHLLADYPVPAFLDSAWLAQDTHAQLFRDWYLKIGGGKPLRKIKRPIPLTNGMVRQLMTTPAGFSAPQALRRAQIAGFGGDRALIEAVLSSHIGARFIQNEFWESVIRFFIAHPLLDRQYVGPIIDYLQHRKFEMREAVGPDGRLERRPPRQPKLNMQELERDKLLRDVAAWHPELQPLNEQHELNFPSSGIKPFQFQQGGKSWKIRELKSTGELFKASQALELCVYSFAESCGKGYCSVWLLQAETDKATEKRLAILLSRSGAVEEMRGKCRRAPKRSELAVIRRWADKADLSITPDLLARI